MVKADDIDWAKIEEFTLALMHLTTFADKAGYYRSWKGLDWDVLERLHSRGWILSPATKAKSVVVTEEGRKRSRKLFERHFLRQGRRRAPR